MKDYLETVCNEVGVAYFNYPYIYLQDHKKTTYRSDSNPRPPNTKQCYEDTGVK
jgi:hypothetical protein